MAKVTRQKAGGGLTRRLHFPDDEKRLPWLPALLDACAITDTGITIAIRDAEKREKKQLACGKDCDVCCHQPDIPLYPHELPGLAWFVSEKLTPDIRAQVLDQCSRHSKGLPCPFLVDHACAVHAVRPIACRQYNVFTVRCSPGEDPYYTRRADVLVPIADYADRAFAAVAAFYGMTIERDREKVVRHIKGKITNLQEYDWKKLVTIMKGTP
jgi:Fe-S-cluster containining protein